MPKLKTHKATVKRFRFSGAKKKKKKKIIRRKAGQNHFNARESGKITMKKRRDVKAHKSTIKELSIL